MPFYCPATGETAAAFPNGVTISTVMGEGLCTEVQARAHSPRSGKPEHWIWQATDELLAEAVAQCPEPRSNLVTPANPTLKIEDFSRATRSRNRHTRRSPNSEAEFGTSLTEYISNKSTPNGTTPTNRSPRLDRHSLESLRNMSRDRSLLAEEQAERENHIEHFLASYDHSADDNIMVSPSAVHNRNADAMDTWRDVHLAQDMRFIPSPEMSPRDGRKTSISPPGQSCSPCSKQGGKRTSFANDACNNNLTSTYGSGNHLTRDGSGSTHGALPRGRSLTTLRRTMEYKQYLAKLQNSKSPAVTPGSSVFEFNNSGTDVPDLVLSDSGGTDAGSLAGMAPDAYGDL